MDKLTLTTGNFNGQINRFDPETYFFVHLNILYFPDNQFKIFLYSQKDPGIFRNHVSQFFELQFFSAEKHSICCNNLQYFAIQIDVTKMSFSSVWLLLIIKRTISFSIYEHPLPLILQILHIISDNPNRYISIWRFVSQLNFCSALSVLKNQKVVWRHVETPFNCSIWIIWQVFKY